LSRELDFFTSTTFLASRDVIGHVTVALTKMWVSCIAVVVVVVVRTSRTWLLQVRCSNFDAGLPAGPAFAAPGAAGALSTRVRLVGAARARTAKNAAETVAERRVVEGVEERVNGRVGVAKPQSQQIEAVVDRRQNKRLDDEHGKVWNPADGERDDDRSHCNHRFTFTHDLRHLRNYTHKRNKLSATRSKIIVTVAIV